MTSGGCLDWRRCIVYAATQHRGIPVVPLLTSRRDRNFVRLRGSRGVAVRCRSASGKWYIAQPSGAAQARVACSRCLRHGFTCGSTGAGAHRRRVFRLGSIKAGEHANLQLASQGGGLRGATEEYCVSLVHVFAFPSEQIGRRSSFGNGLGSGLLFGIRECVKR